MTLVGIISDTHSYMDERILHHLQECHYIFHAGDIGDWKVMDALNELNEVHAVYGNIDDARTRTQLPEALTLNIEGIKIAMIHIAGALGRYNIRTRQLIQKEQPHILICGHSHILKVQQDAKYQLLHINPGAAGRHGFHKTRTLIKVTTDGEQIKDMQVIELGPRSAKPID